MKIEKRNPIKRSETLPQKPCEPETIVDRFFDILRRRASRIELPDFLSPHIDVHESSSSITLEVEIPGMDPHDFSFKVDDDVIRIKGEKRRYDTLSEGAYIRSERRYGIFERAIRLPAEVLDKQACTSYEEGILKISFPKKKDSEAQQV